jgi:hypothetical protein
MPLFAISLFDQKYIAALVSDYLTIGKPFIMVLPRSEKPLFLHINSNT